MSFYDEMQDIATELLTEFDQDGKGGIYYLHSIPGNGPVDDPGPATVTPHRLEAVARGVKFKYVNNALVLASDMQVTFAVIPGVEPDDKGFIKMDGRPDQYKIVQVTAIPAAGTPSAYRIIFRK